MVARAALANARSCKGGRQRPEICFTNRTKVISTYPCGPSSLDENSARFAISSLNRLMRRSALSRDGKFRDARSAIRDSRFQRPGSESERTLTPVRRNQRFPICPKFQPDTAQWEEANSTAIGYRPLGNSVLADSGLQSHRETVSASASHNK